MIIFMSSSCRPIQIKTNLFASIVAIHMKYLASEEELWM